MLGLPTLPASKDNNKLHTPYTESSSLLHPMQIRLGEDTRLVAFGLQHECLLLLACFMLMFIHYGILAYACAGARLTAFELHYNGVPSTLICDSAAAHLMSSGKVRVGPHDGR